MKYKSLLKALRELPPDMLELDVTIWDKDDDEYYLLTDLALVDDISLFFEEAPVLVLER